jgi:hypothetical protein
VQICDSKVAVWVELSSYLNTRNTLIGTRHAVIPNISNYDESKVREDQSSATSPPIGIIEFFMSSSYSRYREISSRLAQVDC